MYEDGKFTPDERKEIVEAINSRTADLDDRCPNCGKGPSGLLESPSFIYFPRRGVALGIAMTVAVTVCENCAFVRQYATQLLQLSFDVNDVVTRKEASNG